MNRNQGVTECTIHTPKISLTNPSRINQLIEVFDYIWVRSKDWRFSTDFNSLMKKSGLSYSSINNIKKAALRMRLFVPVRGREIRFRDDLCRPNEKMILNLIKNEVRTPRVNKLADYVLIAELSSRGYQITKTQESWKNFVE